MGEKVIILVLILLVVALMGGMFVMMNEKINVLENELNYQKTVYDLELEEMKKKQRITAQDVDFLEKMIKEEL